jgi:NADH-quinone oxidoreductase subunit G
MVNLTIDGRSVQVKEGSTIIEAADSVGINIPRLCYWKGLNEIGACRVCVVQIGDDKRRLAAACDALVEEGMVVVTDSPKVIAARKTNLQLILSQHKTNCTNCVRNGNCALQKLSIELNVHSQPLG